MHTLFKRSAIITEESKLLARTFPGIYFKQPLVRINHKKGPVGPGPDA